MQKDEHTFVICAYQENPYLEECIRSVLHQSVLGSVKISTSTPNKYIKRLADKYDLELVVNNGPDSAVDNWNFAYSKVDTPLVTLCHQDDYYFPNYLETVLHYAGKSKKPIIFFTDYCEDRAGSLVDKNRLLQIKRIMNFPLRSRFAWGNRWLRRRILSFGCSICCPSVTFCKENIPGIPFRSQYKNSMDWDTWERFSLLEGDFVYCAQPLMAHRIWNDSITSNLIANKVREKEDYLILCKFWPSIIAKFILNVYARAEKSNELR